MLEIISKTESTCPTHQGSHWRKAISGQLFVFLFITLDIILLSPMPNPIYFISLYFLRILMQCTICARAFTQKGSLQIHMWKHNGFRPHNCSSCNAKFSQKGKCLAAKCWCTEFESFQKCDS